MSKRKRSKTNSKAASDDYFDMFADSDEEKEESEVVSVKKMSNRFEVDDSEGYYLAKIGDLLGTQEKYQVTGTIGRGVFATVVLCNDILRSKQVAIKLIRNNDSMKRSGMREEKLLKSIQNTNSSCPYIITLLSSFEYKNHLCLVFENLRMNLQEVLHQFGKNIGLNFNGVKTYSKQLLKALKFLNKKRIVHADIKLDNILVTNKLGLIKLCDFGSAFSSDDPNLQPTPYLVSRFYRAPEVILGLKYATPVDIWASACCFFELLTGKILFPGESNNQMLELMQETKGRCPRNLIKKHFNAYFTLNRLPHFDPTSYHFNKFIWNAQNEHLTIKPIPYLEKPTLSIKTKLASLDKQDATQKEINNFTAFLDSCLTLNPQKRPSAIKCLENAVFN